MDEELRDCQRRISTLCEEVELQKQEHAERTLMLHSEIKDLSIELRRLISISPGAPARNYTISGMYGYVEAISLGSLTDSQTSRLDSGLRGFLNGGVAFTEYIELDSRKAFSDQFIEFLEEVGLQVQKNWLGFDMSDTKRPGVDAHKLQALHLYHGYAMESPKSLQWYISSRTMETFRMLCLARGLL